MLLLFIIITIIIIIIIIINWHVDSITTQCMFMVAGENSTEELKRQHQALKTASVKSRMESIDSTLPSDLLWSVS